MRDQHVEQLGLLVSVLPSISVERVFALKGGTAINLFYRDLPRLSVGMNDLDLHGRSVRKLSRRMSFRIL